MRRFGPIGARARKDFSLGRLCRELPCQMILKVPPPATTDAPMRDSVLLVDDEKPLLDIYAAALSPRFDLALATSAREAEAWLQEKAFKVIVADHLMPGGNGMELLIRARHDYPHIQRVLVTGYMKPEMLLRGVTEAALFRYLLKPVAVAELIKVVQDAVAAGGVPAVR